ncbi:MAG: TetR/AcrR family transcriptional regulator [Anaerolineae bacterium]|nr:TetR/AcrR family transcriptional regulator [Anaerolineae bacterium]
MTGRENRRDQILEAATRLFMQQGYAATSVREIAEAVGCTEAALYYHFKDGKRALLQAVVEENIPDLIRTVERCQEVESLRAFIVCFARGLAHKARRDMVTKLRWLSSEFHNLSVEEHVLIYAKHTRFREALARSVRRFVSTDVDAEHIAWLLVFVMFGYGQLMITMGMASAVDFDEDGFIERLADTLVAFAERNT